MAEITLWVQTHPLKMNFGLHKRLSLRETYWPGYCRHVHTQVTERQTKLCHMFGSKSDFKTDFQNLRVPSPKTCGSETAFFVVVYDDI